MKLNRTERVAIALSAVLLAAAAVMTFAGNRNSGVAVQPLTAIESPSGVVSAQTAGSETKKININTATAAELETLPGVGRTLAARIVDYRAAHGAFQMPEELMNVSGIGEKTFAALAGQITVDTAEQEGTE